MNAAIQGNTLAQFRIGTHNLAPPAYSYVPLYSRRDYYFFYD
jgi:hypothetical protein